MKKVTGYKLDGKFNADILPVGVDDLERCEPVYESMPGWSESTVGVKSPDGCRRRQKLHQAHGFVRGADRHDFDRTGPEETIVLRIRFCDQPHSQGPLVKPGGPVFSSSHHMLGAPGRLD